MQSLNFVTGWAFSRFVFVVYKIAIYYIFNRAWLLCTVYEHVLSAECKPLPVDGIRYYKVGNMHQVPIIKQ